MMNNCTNNFIKRVIGVTRTFKWTITTNGAAVPLVAEDLTLQLVPPRGEAVSLPFDVDDNVVSFTWQGDDQHIIGCYSLILWANYGEDNQRRVDIHNFVELIPWSDRQSGEYSDLVEETIELETADFGENIMVVDNLNSTSATDALSANMGRQLNVTKQDVIQDLAAIRSGAAAGAAVKEWAKNDPLITDDGTQVSASKLAFNGNLFEQWVPGIASSIGLKGIAGFLKLADISQWDSAYNDRMLPTVAAVKAKLQTVLTALGTIEAVIPSQASSTNKLTDKDYVDGAIATNTANFVGTFDTLAELQAVPNPTKNDYGFVIETDAQGNEYYDRYKYTGTQWLYEYKVESTPFTTEQWAAIQSGITAALVSKLSALPTNAELNTALASKQPVINDLTTIRSGAAAGATAYQKPAAGIPASDLASAVQTSLGKADAALSRNDMATVNGSDLTHGGNVTIVAAEGQTITIDAAPTAGSENAVSSGGTYTAIERSLEPIVSPVSLATFNAEDFLGATNGVTPTWGDNQVTLTFTETANPAVYFGTKQLLQSGKTYILTFEIVSGSLGASSNHKLGLYNNGSFTNNTASSSPYSLQDGKFTLEATLTGNADCIRVMLVYSSKTVTIKNLNIYEKGNKQYLVNNNIIKNLSPDNFNSETSHDVNAVKQVVDDYIPHNFFDPSVSEIYKSSDNVSVSYLGNGQISVMFTDTINPIICWASKLVSTMGLSYKVSFKVSKGSISSAVLRAYVESNPTSGTQLASFTETNGVWTATFTTGSVMQVAKYTIDVRFVYSSKDVVLEDICFCNVDDESKSIVKTSAIGSEYIGVSFLYNTESSDCTILNIVGNTESKVVMIDSGDNSNTMKDSMCEALTRSHIAHIDYFILSHWHADHCGLITWLQWWGLIDQDTIFYLPTPPVDSEGLMREDNVDRVVVERSQEITEDIQSWGCTIIYPDEDDVLVVNGCQFAFWNTDHSDYYAMSFVDYNECSLCCTMSYGEKVVQFTGDIGTIACNKYYDKLYKCNIFKANHHACGYAVVPRFMSAVCPEIVVTMAGSNIIYSTNPNVQAVFATLSTGLQQWCEDEFVPNYVTGVIGTNIYMTISKCGFKFDNPARRCVRADEGIPVQT